MGLRAVVFGGTGLVGSELLRLLTADRRFSAVVSVVRRAGTDPPPGCEARQVALDGAAETLQAELGQTLRDSLVFCCLGTTRRAAGSVEAFRRVDLELPVRLAAIARHSGAAAFLVVSSLGADSGSRGLYLRTKGEMEREVRREGPPRVEIARPSLLLGARRELRLGERLGQLLGAPLAPLLPRRARPIRAVTVARALLRLACEQQGPGGVWECEELQRLGAADD